MTRSVLILDEPTNGLDPRAAREVQDRLRRSSAEGKTIFLSTHLLDMAERLCSRVGIIHQGELVAEGTLQELRARIVPGGSLEEVFLKVTQPEDAAAGDAASCRRCRVNPGTPMGPMRAARLLVRLRLARLFNQLTSGMQLFRRKGASGQRGATAGKSKIGWFVGGLVGLSMLFSFTNLAYQALAHMQDRLGTTTTPPAQSRPEPAAAQGWLGAQGRNLTKAEAETLGWERPRGAKVTGSFAGSPAAKAGLLPRRHRRRSR